ncbi:MAG: hypothetical protein M1454_05400 [Candidatus Thermoplasmatota archaeon]|nr:hypothetical protein [Candidatus Thermoplasmatota archaeon]MCL5730678.1 hypothetical protein [Candidatus Thermoplasmatota archaeon]
MPALRRKPSDNPNKIIREIRSGNSLKSIPNVLIPLWQIKLRERFGINVDREIATYVVLAAHESGTWKKHRAIKRIEKLLISRGEDPKVSARIAEEIVALAVGNMQ